MAVIEELPEEDKEEGGPGLAAAQAAAPRDARVVHPAALGVDQIASRHLEVFVNHPGCVRPVVRDGKRASALKEQGNAKFKDGAFSEAVELYSDALEHVPQQDEFKYMAAVCLGNRAACFLQTGQLEDVVEDCSEALELDPRYVKALLRRATAHEKLDDLDSALADLKKVIEIEPTLRQAVRDHDRLDKLVKAKHDKLKDEMMGKLKELGNGLLGKFGLSLDNFKTVQDPATGSYSISFNQGG